MTLEQLEKRVIDLERQVAELRGRLEPVVTPQNAEATFGSIDDDAEYEEIVRLGREYRRQANGEGQVMLVLDTDHIVEYQKGTSAEAVRLKERLDGATEPYATTILTVEEIMPRLNGGRSADERSAPTNQCLYEVATAFPFLCGLEPA